ncbi:MAG: hypothetical protein ACI81L_000307 [Verrucomicrobiales bacterium]
MVRGENYSLTIQQQGVAADRVCMKRWILVGLFSVLVASCTAQPDVASPPPTVVAPANPISGNTSNTAPAQLAFEDWSSEDVAAQIESALDGPATIVATGPIFETLEISGDAWRVTTSTATTGLTPEPGSMVIRGAGEREWVTYGSVRDRALVESDLNRAFFDETAALGNTWVVHLRNQSGAFSPSFLSLDMIRGIVGDLVADIRTSSSIETTLTEADLVAVVPDTEFSSITLERRGSSIDLTTSDGFTLSITSGVADVDRLGTPDPRDVLTRPLLIASTSFPQDCVSPVIEARALIENGPILCETDDEYDQLQQWFETSFTNAEGSDGVDGHDE